MLAHERLAELEGLLKAQGQVQVSSLARQWGVSDMTVRRDLQRLEAQGVVARVHGGAVASGGLRFQARLDRNRKAKRTAVAKLADLLPDQGCIYLDGSTTIFQLIEHLGRHPGLSVATNNVDTFHRLSQMAGIKAILLGGTLNPDTDNLVGPLARRALAGLSFSAAFASAYAIHPEVGPAEPAIDDAEIKQLVCERAARVHLAINHHKLGERATGTWLPAPEHSVLASDLEPEDERLTPYRPLFAEIR